MKSILNQTRILLLQWLRYVHAAILHLLPNVRIVSNECAFKLKNETCKLLTFEKTTSRNKYATVYISQIYVYTYAMHAITIYIAPEY